MKKIPLRNKFRETIAYALVDNEDFDFLNQWRWSLTIPDYAVRGTQIGGKKGKHVQFKMHRLIMNCPKDKVIDHINGNGLDNRKSNLRICTQAENARNGKRRSTNKSGHKGVYWNKIMNKWEPSIVLNNKTIHGGYFTSLKEAIQKYAELSAKHHGKFGRLS